MRAPSAAARALLPLGVACAVFGTVVCLIADDAVELPAREALHTHHGVVTEVQRSRSALRLRLQGSERTFRYLSKAGEMTRVREALRDAGNAAVTVRFDPATPWMSPGVDAPLYTVYELSVPGRIERTHAQVAEAWRNDERLGRWLGGAFIVIGGALTLRALVARR
jgi:hypothetical protein